MKFRKHIERASKQAATAEASLEAASNLLLDDLFFSH
jgi:hypothetical protein